MSVEEGTVHGFLGPNGAGKSTTIRTLLGLLHPTAGKVRVLGKNPLQHPEILRRVGYVPGDVALDLRGGRVRPSVEARQNQGQQGRQQQAQSRSSRPQGR